MSEFSVVPVRVWVFVSFAGEWWSRAIQWVTWRLGMALRDVPSHAGIGFDMADGTSWYYEAIRGGGWMGPRDAGRLEEFSSKPGRWVRRFDVTMDADQIGAVYRECDSRRGVWLYSEKQLWLMYLYQRFGKRVPQTDDSVVCSEGVSRLLWPWIDLPYWAGVEAHDEMSPRHVLDAMVCMGARGLVAEVDWK